MGGYCGLGAETSSTTRLVENPGGEQGVGPRLGLPRVKRGTEGCNPTSGGIGYIIKRAKRAQ